PPRRSPRQRSKPRCTAISRCRSSRRAPQVVDDALGRALASIAVVEPRGERLSDRVDVGLERPTGQVVEPDHRSERLGTEHAFPDLVNRQTGTVMQSAHAERLRPMIERVDQHGLVDTSVAECAHGSPCFVIMDSSFPGIAFAVKWAMQGALVFLESCCVSPILSDMTRPWARN